MSDASSSAPATKSSIDGKKVFLWWTRFLKVLAVLTLLFNVASYIVIIVAGTKKDNGLDNLEKSFLVLAAIGLIIFALALAVAEFEPRWFIEKCYVLHFWTGRGFFIAWMGIQSINNAKTMATALTVVNSKDDQSLVDFMTLFSQIIGWVMIGVGAVYVFMSLLCLRNCLPDDQKDELQVNLIAPENSSSSTTNVVVNSSGGGSSSSAAGSSSNSADALIIANLAIALGMSGGDVRNKFGSSAARREAETIARDRADALARGAEARARQSAVDAAAKANAQKQASQAMLKEQSAAYVPPAVAATPAASAAAPAASSAPLPTNQSIASSKSSSQANDDPFSDDGGSRRRRMDDDDELERAYYASHAKQ